MSGSACVAGDHEMDGGLSGVTPGALAGLHGAEAAGPWPGAPAWAGRQWVPDPLAARGVAHDLNNLLTLIVGHAEIALGAAAQGSALHTSLEQIAHAADIGASLAGKWLRAGRSAAAKPHPTGINPIVRNALDIFQPLLLPDIRLELELAPVLWPALVDPVALEEVVINLVDNAREAMPWGGTLAVRTENIVVGSEAWRGAPGARPGRPSASSRRPERVEGRWVCVTVADTGVGMDRSTLDRLFEPCFTAKPHGTGLGLAMVRRIVQEHGGWIAATSESGHGATFQVFLPVTL